ncbi:HAD family hydrolase [Actinomadura viridis]|uniref:HAD family hydrolase n=1 Tax=Actinomadura viridis TaxID=58110 RepID=UPI00368AC535
MEAVSLWRALGWGGAIQAVAFDYGGTLDRRDVARGAGGSYPVSATAQQVIGEVARLGLVLLLATNTTPDQDRHPALAQAGVAHHFSCLLQSHQLTTDKPDAEFFELVHQKAGCPPEAILFVGDNPNHDVHPALEHGMNAVLVAPAAPIDLPAGAAHITDLAHLPGLLKGTT